MSSKLYTLEDSLGLHSRVEIIYVVDGYQASLIKEDDTILFTAWGESIAGAVQNLNDAIKGSVPNET